LPKYPAHAAGWPRGQNILEAKAQSKSRLPADLYSRGKRKFPKELQMQFDTLYGDVKIPKIKPAKIRKAYFGFPMMFKYSPKHASTLPYYDVLPMPILLAKYPDGFLGLNIHYLPWSKRLQLADRLVRATKNRKRITYPQLKRAWNSLKLPNGYAYLIIRRYLTSHIQSDIAVFDWDNYRAAAVNIPGKWRKKSEKAVFKAMMVKWQDHVKDKKKKDPKSKVKHTKSTRRKTSKAAVRTVKRRGK
jgi:hypothetical protein